jgi:hypothetical protein
MELFWQKISISCMLRASNQHKKQEDVTMAKTVLNEDWNQDQTLEVIYAEQSIAASKGQKVTEPKQAVEQGPIPQPLW